MRRPEPEPGRRSDRTIFFSSHFLGDVERVADYLAVLDYSVLRACCPLDTFRNSVCEMQLSFVGSPPALPELPGLLQAWRTDRELRLIFVHFNSETEAALRALQPQSMSQVDLGLEDAFISYLGERGEKSFIPLAVPEWSMAKTKEFWLPPRIAMSLVIALAGLWITRRGQFPATAQIAWFLCIVLFGLPGILAFVALQEFPPREACPGCKRMRSVDREICAHCNAPFEAPAKTGTEIFASLTAG